MLRTMRGFITMSKQKKGKKTTLADLEVVPYEKSIPYYLEQNRDELIRREEVPQAEARRTWETSKNIVVGGPLDKTNQ